MASGTNGGSGKGYRRRRYQNSSRVQQSTLEVLDPSILDGYANLIDEVDKMMLVVLQDGRTLRGILRSVDKFANLILHEAVERVQSGNIYADIPRGVFFVRGEHVMLVGEINKEKEKHLNLKRVPVDTILAVQREEQELKAAKELKHNEILKKRGLLQLHNDSNLYEDL